MIINHFSAFKSFSSILANSVKKKSTRKTKTLRKQCQELLYNFNLLLNFSFLFVVSKN